MWPYPNANLCTEKQIFNEYLLKVIRVIENNILTNYWHVHICIYNKYNVAFKKFYVNSNGSNKYISIF